MERRVGEQGRSLDINGSGTLSARQREEQAERMAVVEPVRPGPRRGRKRKIALVTAGVLLVLVGAAPTLVGKLGRGVVESKLSGALGSGVRIEKLGLSWWGDQRVRSLRIVDGSLREVADVDVRLERSLLGLALNWKDLGTIVVSGEVTIDEREGALGGLIAVDKSEASESDKPVKLPGGLNVRLRADGLDVTHRDEDGKEFQAQSVSGSVRLGVGSELAVDLAGSVSYEGWTGRVQITTDVAGLTDSTGLVTFDRINATGSVVLAGDGSPIDRYLAEGFESGAYTSELTFAATPERGIVSAVFDSPELAAALPISFSRSELGYRVELSSAGTFRAGGSAVGALLPELSGIVGEAVELESGQMATLDAAPGVSARLNEFGITLPTGGRAPDLSTLVVRGRVETGGLTGSLDGEAWVIEPTSLDVTTRGVKRGVSVQAVTTARLSERPAGVFVLNAEASEIYSASGALPGSQKFLETLLAGMRGGVEINDVEGALIDSLAGAWLRGAGVSVAQDFGARVDAEVAFEGGVERALRVFVGSDNVRGSAGFLLDGSVIRSDGAGVRFEADSVAPLVSRQLRMPGVTLTEGGRAELWVRDVVLDLDRLRADGAVDLRALRGQAEIRLDPMSGVLEIAGEAHTVSTSASAVTVDLLDVGAGAGIAGAMTLQVDGELAGDASVSLRATELVDAQGRLMPGIPRIEGEVTVRNAMTRLAQPALGSAGLVLAEDIGPRLDVLARASVDAEGTVSVRLDTNAAQMTGFAEFEIEDRSLRSVGQGVNVEIRNVGRVVRRSLPETMTTDDGGGMTLKSNDLQLALGELGVDWAQTKLSADLGLLGLRISNQKSERYQADRLDLKLAFDGAAGTGTVELSGLLSQSGEPVAAGGKIVASGLVTSGVLSPDAARLDGRIDLGGLPVALATQVADPTMSSGRVLAAELLGRLLDVTLVADGEAGTLRLDLKSDRLTGEFAASLAAGDLTVQRGSLKSVIGPEVIEQIRLRAGQAAGKAEPVGAQFVEPAQVELTLGGFELLRGWSLSAEGKPEVKLVASGMVEGLPIRRGQEVIRSGAIGLEPLTVEGQVPVAALLGGASEVLSFALAAEVVTREGAVATLTGGMDVGFESGRPGGVLRTDLKLSEMDAGLVDDVALLDGLFAGVFGAKLGADLSIQGEVASGSVDRLDGQLTLSSPRLRTEGPIKLAVTEDRVTVAEPALVRWDVAPEIATKYGFAQPVGAERVRVEGDSALSVRVDRLSISRGDGPVRPGVFDVSARVEASKLRLFVPHESSGEAEGIAHEYAPLYFSVEGDSNGLVLEGRAQPTEADREAITFGAQVSSFAGEGGRILFNQARVDGELVVKDAPTAMIDGLLAQDGLMLEVFGPSSTIDLLANGLQAESGSLTMDLKTTRASGRLVSRMFEGRLIAIEPAKLVVHEVRPELGNYLGEAIPVVGRVTKGPEDGPATLTVKTLEVPLFRHSELSRLQDLEIEAEIDLGTARFQTSSIFSKVMKAAQQRTEGGIGRKMSPISLTINSGVLTYPRTKIPIGEFTIESAGTIRLTDGYIDVVTYVPMVALTEEALGSLKTGLTSLLGRQIPIFESVTQVPWRTKGMPGKQKTLADVELLLQNVGDTLNPLNLINQGLGSLQGLVIDKPKPKAEKKEGE